MNIIEIIFIDITYFIGLILPLLVPYVLCLDLNVRIKMNEH